ncbi:MAG TPA: tetratricopeptide repeat protein, partial [Solirubrobacteraceae bacterium]|nr:tetratricopeptide repeat protein [Solirubrobacteraceae bacterium]
NPDTTVAILRGRLLMREGHYRAALPVLERVVAQEPENLDGWVFVAQAGLKIDRAELNVAVAHIARLYKQFKQPPR